MSHFYTFKEECVVGILSAKQMPSKYEKKQNTWQHKPIYITERTCHHYIYTQT